MNTGIQTLLDVGAVTYQLKPKGSVLGSSEEIVPAHMRSSLVSVPRHITTNGHSVSGESCQAWLPSFSFLGSSENVLEAIFTLPSQGRQGTVVVWKASRTIRSAEGHVSAIRS